MVLFIHVSYIKKIFHVPDVSSWWKKVVCIMEELTSPHFINIFFLTSLSFNHLGFLPMVNVKTIAIWGFSSNLYSLVIRERQIIGFCPSKTKANKTWLRILLLCAKNKYFRKLKNKFNEYWIMVIFVFDPDCDIESWLTIYTNWKILVNDGPSFSVIDEIQNR